VNNIILFLSLCVPVILVVIVYWALHRKEKTERCGRCGVSEKERPSMSWFEHYVTGETICENCYLKREDK